jgi:hypothetical protein
MEVAAIAQLGAICFLFAVVLLELGSALLHDVFG